VEVTHTYYSQEAHGPFETFNLGDFDLEDGSRIRNLTLAYATFGKLNERKDNAILIPTWYSGTSKIIGRAPCLGGGGSMGAQQTYEWAVRYPYMVERAAPIAGTAKNTEHDFLFVETLADAITSDPGFKKGSTNHPRMSGWACCATPNFGR